MSWGSIALGCFAIAAWLSAFLFVRAALERPRIGALNHWAVSALLLSLFGTVCLVVMVNRERAYEWFPPDVAAILFGLAVFGVLLIPPAWLFGYITNRLGKR